MAAAGCFCLASRQAARKITRLYDSCMQGSGLRDTQFTILSQLMLRGEMPIGKLAGSPRYGAHDAEPQPAACWSGKSGFRSAPVRIRARA